MNFKVDKDIAPPPTYKGVSQSKSKYPWDEMEVGDSFLVPYGNRQPLNLQSNMLTIGNSRRSGYRVVTKQEPEGIRVWRIS